MSCGQRAQLERKLCTCRAVSIASASPSPIPAAVHGTTATSASIDCQTSLLLAQTALSGNAGQSTCDRMRWYNVLGQGGEARDNVVRIGPCLTAFVGQVHHLEAAANDLWHGELFPALQYLPGTSYQCHIQSCYKQRGFYCSTLTPEIPKVGCFQQYSSSQSIIFYDNILLH